jgi:hypothetical protein
VGALGLARRFQRHSVLDPKSAQTDVVESTRAALFLHGV